MQTVLFISATGPVWWQKSAQDWTELSAQAAELLKSSVWVLTDLPEESFGEITVPRIFGTDRRSFVQRQLASRYPDTVFRMALPAPGKGSLMERLAPPTQTLAAVDPGEKILAALKLVPGPLVGVWSTSLLLTHLGQMTGMPKDLFVVLCRGDNLRILFIKQRSPMLTRLVTTAPSAAEQAAELVRTLRHLENTRVIDRGRQRFGVLLLGTAEGLATLLARERLDAVPVPGHLDAQHPADWNHKLFDLVCKNPPGQLAPMGYRASYLARGVRLGAKVGVVVSVLLALWIASSGISDSLQVHTQRNQLNAKLRTLNGEIVAVDQNIQAIGVSPDSVRKALALDAEEIASAPDMQAQLTGVAKVIGAQPGARLKSMQWQIVSPTEALCNLGAALAAPAAPLADSATEAPPSRKVELRLEVLLDEHIGPLQLLRQATAISGAFGQLAGTKILLDPALALQSGEIRVGGIQSQKDQPLLWCLGLPGVAPTSPVEANGGAL